MNNAKDFKLENKDDYIYYLTELLLSTNNYLQANKSAIDELGDFIDSHNLLNKDQLVEEDYYIKFRDRINESSLSLLNVFGDHANFACSYQNYRKLIKETDFSYLELSSDEQSKLNQLTTTRNWVAHIPLSLLNSYKERGRDVRAVRNDDFIFYPVFEKYESRWLIDLYGSSLNHLKDFKKWFECLKSEYKVLTGRNCVLTEFKIDVRPFSDIAVSQVSLMIQKKEIKTLKDVENFYSTQDNS